MTKISNQYYLMFNLGEIKLCTLVGTYIVWVKSNFNVVKNLQLKNMMDSH